MFHPHIKSFFMKRNSIGLLGFLFLSFYANAQSTLPTEEIKPGQFDQGKMWTFENPPYDYFNKTYGVSITKDWMDDARMSALRFASWCSASFVSGSGLILTNQHCTRGVVGSVQKENENFDKNGFYAQTLADERKIPGLYVDQLVKIADITDKVKSMSNISPDSAIDVIVNQYKQDNDWKDLHLETRTFYSGEKYSLYGYKRYSDIRLVLFPELDIGFFGGDPDNFTYPRYDLDFSLVRAYDDKGNPLKPSNYFKFDQDGPSVNDPVFIIGNPGSTGRYMTVAELYNLRDMVLPMRLTFIRSRMNILRRIAAGQEKKYNADSLNNLIFELSNSEKDYTGILKGLNDPVIMAKKENKEKMVRASVKMKNINPWDSIAKDVNDIKKYRPEQLLLRPYPADFAITGKVPLLINLLDNYRESLQTNDTSQVNGLKVAMNSILSDFDRPLETELFTEMLYELKTYSTQGYMDQLLEGKSPGERAKEVIDKSVLINKPDKFFGWKENKLKNEPLFEFTDVFTQKYQEARKLYRQYVQSVDKYNKNIINLQYEISGLSTPPDATFSLRISDGVVKGYDYNGTYAPPFTTFYGLYDRYYSHGKKYPWDLPERWLNPPADLLKSPLDFVCTADIIGGNSGSPVINADRELVGLVFDGNIESLPGYFIFDDTYNRAVSVDAAGIIAGLKYIFHADRILEELK